MKFFCAAAIIMFIISGCKNETNGIPYFPVNITIYMDNPEWIELNVIGGWEYVSGGSKGIIVFRNGTEEFMAYERHSVYNPEDGCKIYVDSTGIVAEDADCSGSRFNLFNGSVIEGPASLPLHAYRTSFSNGVLQIFN